MANKPKPETRKKGIPCPKCGHMVSDIEDTRHKLGYITRRRKCRKCQNMFRTTELCDDDLKDD